MKLTNVQRRVMIVSSSDKIYDYLSELLPQSEFSPVLRAKSAGEAKRELASEHADILIINTPLPDDFGTGLALEMSESSMGILLLVKSDLFEQVAYKVESSGILTLQKPNSEQTIHGAIRLLCALNSRLCKMEKKQKTLQEKMEDIRAVNRAKWLLIENLKMSERDAHYYIERQAMDARIPRPRGSRKYYTNV